MLRKKSTDHHKAVPVSLSIVVESKAGTFSRIDKADMLACQSRHTEGNTFGIALISVKENDEGKAVACT